MFSVNQQPKIQIAVDIFTWANNFMFIQMDLYVVMFDLLSHSAKISFSFSFLKKNTSLWKYLFLGFDFII